jgi:L-fucose isomerase-like protein
LLSAVKLYMAVKRAIEQEGNVLATGINCLNESQFSDTTPCLAWAMLYEEQGLIWGCEADTLSMLTEFLLHRSLDVPLMMTNLYPFLMGRAATEHEHIPGFPPVENPENCILTAHCGYLGVVPPSFSTEWTLRPKVLAIVDDNATAIDARLPEGPVTLAKLDPTLETISVVEGNLESYVQFPNSHCLNGGIIRIPDGRKLLDNLPSHHSIILVGHRMAEIRMLGKVFGIEVEAVM